MAGRTPDPLHGRRQPAVAGGGAALPTVPLRHRNALGRLYARLGEVALVACHRPVAATAIVLAVNFGLALLLAPLGWVVTGDQALFFRELMPGTWLSFVELVFVSAVAWTAHEWSGAPQPAATSDGRAHRGDFWLLSAGVFLVLAVDEITQATMFLSKWLKDGLGLAAPEGFVDVDSAILVLLFLLCALVLVRGAVVLLRHRTALLLLVVAGALGAGSQAIDSVVPASAWETVVEDSLKLAAAAFFVGGYLAALRDLTARAAAAPRQAAA